MAINWDSIEKQSKKFESSLKKFDSRAPKSLPKASPSVGSKSDPLGKSSVSERSRIEAGHMREEMANRRLQGISSRPGSREDRISSLEKEQKQLRSYLTNLQRGNSGIRTFSNAGSDRGHIERVSSELGRVSEELIAERNALWQEKEDRKQTSFERVRERDDFEKTVEDAKKGSHHTSYASIPHQEAVGRELVKVLTQPQYGPMFASGLAAGGTKITQRVDQLTDEEKDTILYYAGKGDYAGAARYYDQLGRTLDARRQGKASKANVELSEEHPFVGSAVNIAASFGTPLAYLANAGQAVKNAVTGEYEPTNTNSGWFSAAHAVEDTTKGVSKAAEDMPFFGDIEIDGKNMGSFLAETGLSIGQFASKLPMGGYALPFMGADAGGRTTLDTLERGGTPGQALTMGTASGIIEAATEKIGLDRLMGVARRAGKSGVSKLLLDIGGQALTEGAEEAISEIANNIVDASVMKGRSEMEQYARELEARGMTREQAEREALEQFALKNTMWAAAGGALSGGILGAGGSTVGYSLNRPFSPDTSVGPYTNRTNLNTEQQKTAPAKGAAEYRAERPQNVEFPTVPIIQLSMDSVARLNGGRMPETGNYLRKSAYSDAASRLGLDKNEAAYIEANNVTRNGDSYVIKITKSSLKKMLSASSYPGDTVPLESIAVLGQLERIAQNGVYYKSEGDRKGRDQVAGYDHLMTTVYIDGEPYVVDMRVRVDDQKSGGTNRLYYFTPEAITAVKKRDGTTSTAGRHATSVHSTDVTPSHASSITQTSVDGNIYPGQLYTEQSDFIKEEIRNDINESPAMSEEEWASIFSQDVGPESSVGAAMYGFDPYTNLQGKYGTIIPGENPSRIVDVPKKTSDKSKVSLTARTVMEAAATPDSAIPDIAQLVVDGRLSYMPISNKQRAVMAENKIRNVGYSDALENWKADVRAGKSSADLVAMGAQLYNATVNAGDTKAAMDILYDYTRLIRSGAQATQAGRILKTLTPAGTLYMIQKEVNNINEAQYGKKRRNFSSTDNVPVEIWMQRVGENLADELSRRIEAPKNQVRTVSQTILSDLRRYANETAPKRLQKGKTRTEMDRIMDLFQNKSAYNEAWSAAKDTLSDMFENDPDALAAFDSWIDQSLDYTKALTKELTNQSDIVISEELADAFLSADTEEARARALDAIYQNVADQMPSTLLEKFNALRYTNMLGNFKTIGRNTAGNVVMKGVRAVKVKQAAAIEAIANKVSGGKIQRSTTFLRDKALYKQAISDFESVKPFAMGAGKYSDSSVSSPMSEINERRAIFKNSGVWGTLPTSSTAAKALRRATDIAWKIPESYRVATDWLMNNKYFGDEAFSRSAYADTLSRYLKANGVTAEQMKSGTVDPSILERAREKAISAAREATFRDNNQFAEAISSIGFKKPDTLAKKAINAGLQGNSPFLRTPANVLVTAERYSPLGIVNTAIQAARATRGSNQVSWNDVIDSLSSTLTGTGIFLLGMFLRDQGWLVGGSGDDDKQASFDDLTGKQEYALVLSDGQSFTLDWLSPVSMPLFIGVEYADAAAEGGISTEDALNAVKSMSDVLLNMSMMQGINDQLTDISYSEYPLFDLALNSLLGYLQQGLTNSLAGQAERSFEHLRMTTYTDKNLPIPTNAQYLLGRTSAKTPGWDYQQIPYIDAWGRQEPTGPLPLRTFNNFINPAYTSQENMTPLDKEIQRIYDQTGDGAVMPSRAPRYLTVGGERIDLTADQYVQYATDRGEMSYDIGSDIIKNSTFKRLSDEQKAEVLDDVYTYADAIAKSKVSDYDPDDWITEVEAAGIDPSISILYHYSDAKSEAKRQMLMDDDRLSAKEKSALDKALISDKSKVDYTNEETFTLSQMSDAAQRKYEKAEALGMGYADYAKYYHICTKQAKKEEVINALVSAGMSKNDAYKFYSIVKSK